MTFLFMVMKREQIRQLAASVSYVGLISPILTARWVWTPQKPIFVISEYSHRFFLF